MAAEPDPVLENPTSGEDDLDEEDEEEEEIQPELPNTGSRESRARIERAKLESLFRRIQTEMLPLRVHDVIIKGNSKTKDSLIEAETALLKDVSSMQELMAASKDVNFRLQALEVFDSVRITLDSGPPELPGTANVIVEVVETKCPLSGEVGAYTKGEARSSTVEGSVKYKNIFGYGDLWDASLAYGGDHMAEVSSGVYLPRFKRLAPVTARVFLLSQDWLKFSSFKERTLGLSVGLVSSRNHDLVYNLSWRTLTDPSQMASRSIRRQLGHGLLSSLKYTFKIDRRNSPLRPTHGYAFVSTTQIGGLAPDSRSIRFLRQELDLRYAVPLGFLHSALNLGISGGLIFPWGTGFLNMPSPLPERFFLGGNLSPICTLGGPIALYGFRTRGLGPTDLRRQLQSNPTDDSADPGRDYIGGDLAVTAFADVSFDFPSKWCQSKGIHGHMFASTGNIDKLTENAYQNLSLRKFVESFRTSAGVGIVVPTNLFRLEVRNPFLLSSILNLSNKA
ncbi:uncharacterized protein LOC110668376 isoform X2 [Hevea brasiliensis]|uniref:uncharacterized protein LOC110668376 isoform X2 n=1 Tax=Hevea brasiliensis TaxID=3981 RepID=UPI0025F305C4|nr:uncharacterized protein LOC110668376 isoform X2 [Hevea brasiliensis]